MSNEYKTMKKCKFCKKPYEHKAFSVCEKCRKGE